MTNRLHSIKNTPAHVANMKMLNVKQLSVYDDVKNLNIRVNITINGEIRNVQFTTLCYFAEFNETCDLLTVNCDYRYKSSTFKCECGCEQHSGEKTVFNYGHVQAWISSTSGQWLFSTQGIKSEPVPSLLASRLTILIGSTRQALEFFNNKRGLPSEKAC